ncbi:MAG TPA: alpha/beta fold hydrolase [Streptosporangiaceae bacterium]
MTAGLSMLKESQVAEIASAFQAAGISVLAYDHRGFGSSDGSPRYDIDPARHAEDFHDAITAAANLPGADPKRIVLLGTGHSGGWAAIAASDDPRVAALVLHRPFFSGALQQQAFPADLIDRAWLERIKAVDLSCFEPPEPEYVKAWPESVEEARSQAGLSMMTGEPGYWFVREACELMNAAGARWENKVTLRSAYNVARIECQNALGKVSVPTLYLVGETDPFMSAEQHRVTFGRLSAKGEFARVPDQSNVSTSQMFADDAQPMIHFITRVV